MRDRKKIRKSFTLRHLTRSVSAGHSARMADTGFRRGFRRGVALGLSAGKSVRHCRAMPVVGVRILHTRRENAGLLCEGSDGTVWETKTGKLIASLNVGETSRAVVISPDGNQGWRQENSMGWSSLGCNTGKCLRELKRTHQAIIPRHCLLAGRPAAGLGQSG